MYMNIINVQLQNINKELRLNAITVSQYVIKDHACHIQHNVNIKTSRQLRALYWLHYNF